MLLGADYPFLDILWTMFIFFLFVIWIWILITVFVDIFRRRDTSGVDEGAVDHLRDRAPYLGVLIYLIVNHDGMADRNIQQMQATTAKTDAYIQSVAKRRICGRDREGQGPARLRCDHAGRVRHDQAEGARRPASSSLTPGGPLLSRLSRGR